MPVFLYFEDASRFAHQLTTNGLPNVGVVIKVFPSISDPEERQPGVVRLISTGWPFPPDNLFTFPDGRQFSARDIIGFMNQNTGDPIAKGLALALFNFSRAHGFVDRAMMLRKEGKPVIDNPMEVVHGWKYANANPYKLHLDIFLPESLPVLRRIVDYTNLENLMDWKIGARWRAQMR